MKKKRKQYAAAEKVSILREHLLEGKRVSDLCDEYGLHPTMFYRWQKEFFEGGHRAFEKSSNSAVEAEKKKARKLEERLRRKDEVLAEIAAEFVTLKKRVGED